MVLRCVRLALVELRYNVPRIVNLKDSVNLKSGAFFI